jgi:hypothetical protein
MPRRTQKRVVTPADATPSKTSPRLSLHREGLVIITLLKPLGAIREVLIDPKAPAVCSGEIRMMSNWCSDLLHT